MTALSPHTIEDEMATAQAILEEAEKALHADLLRAATSQAYYAMLHATKAALAKKGLEAKSHKGTLKLFHRHFIQPRAFEDEYGDLLSEAHDDRELADYHAMTGSFDIVDVRKLVIDARRFVERIKRFLGE